MESQASSSGNRRSGSRLAAWYVRVPLKLLVLGGVTFFVLFPYPRQFARHLSHLSNMEAMVEPDAPELAAWEAELKAELAEAEKPATPGGDTASEDATDPSRRIPIAVQAFIYRKIAYGWDWDVWGSADYMPTVSEMFAQAAAAPDGRMREDCDGRAIMAASLLRRLGVDASVATDLRHVWVVTPQGEWMGPGRKKTIVSTSRGNRMSLRTAWSNVPTALSFGLAVFPLWRELIILATAFLLLLRRGMTWRSAALGGLLLVQGLLFMRLGYLAPERVSRSVSAWPAWVGGAHVLSGLVTLWWSSIRAGRLATVSARAN
ncbi:MAG: hypothetical protein ACE5E1_07335 [Phycisphaerae bacterium]